MPLTVGARLGPYEILSLLGAGGMGEVYRARDERLKRDVAIKVLPASYSRDADRLRRFEHEAQAAGGLNHPNITAVYDLGTVGGSPYVVSELLEGETLRSRLSGGALVVRKALDYARQIAAGLAAAHEKGIVHRDLKPENLFVTRDGRVKIFDFGLAKLTQPEDAVPQTNFPTATAGTEPGVVLGTLGYMSPEQVRGKPADARSDIFAFGAILYEMLSGKRAFHGDSAADTMSAILREEPPDLSKTNHDVPPALERVVRHCLEKNPEERFHSAHDLAFDLEALSGVSSGIRDSALIAGRRAVSLRLSRSLVFAGLAILAIVAGIVLDRFLLRRRSAEPPRVRYLTYSGRDWSPAASPDGKTVAFVSSRDGRMRIWLKQLAGGGETALTSGPDLSPRFSPDGSSVLFTRVAGDRNSIYRVSVLGGEPRKLVDDAFGADWSPDGNQIAFARPQTSSLWIAASDGTGAREIARTRQDVFLSPRWSPDGRAVAVTQGGARVRGRILLVSTDGKEQRPIMPPEGGGPVSEVAWSGSGDEIVYGQSEALTAEYRSAPGRVVLQNVRSGKARIVLWSPNMGEGFDILESGRIVLSADSSRQNLRELTRQGASPPSESRWLTRGHSTDRQPVYSPDGEWVLFTSDRTGNNDLWTVSTKSGALRRLTDDPGEDWDPAFSADGKHLVWSSNRSGDFEIWMSDADGSGARQVTKDGVDAENPTATPDGWIVYTSFNPARRGLWKIRSDGTKEEKLVGGNPTFPQVSPDGRFASYSDERLRIVRVADGATVPFEVPLPAGPGMGRSRWAPDGRAIAFVVRDSEGRVGIFVQDFTPGRDSSSSRRVLGGFDPDQAAESFAISPDGSRVTIAVAEQFSALMLAEGVGGVSPPRRRVR
jgi:Tol biopolymer transport system component